MEEIYERLESLENQNLNRENDQHGDRDRHERHEGRRRRGLSVEPAESKRPFRALLDVGLIKTTTGNRVFGALKVIYYIVMLISVILFYWLIKLNNL